MKNTYCVTATYEGVQVDPCVTKRFARVKADGKALFVQLEDFGDARILQAIPAGTSVAMGVRAYADGTFGMYWLHAPGYGTLAPQNRGDTGRDGLRKTLRGILGIALSILFIAIWLHGGPGAHALVLGIIWAVAAIWGVFELCIGVHRLMLFRNKSMQFLQSGLERVRTGDSSFCLPLAGVVSTYKDDGGLREFLTLVQENPASSDIAMHAADGEVTQLQAMQIAKGAGRYARYYLVYQFMCAGRACLLEIRDDTPSLHAVFRKSHPFVLAEGDRVRVVTSEDGVTVKGLHNLEDGCFYTVNIVIPRLRDLALIFALGPGIAACSAFFLGLVEFVGADFSFDFLLRKSLFMSTAKWASLLICGIVWITGLVVWCMHRTPEKTTEARLVAEGLGLDGRDVKSKRYLHQLVG